MIPRGRQGSNDPQSGFSQWMTTVLCAVLGVASLGFCVWHGWQSVELERHGSRTMGEIVDPEQHPKVGFVDGSGRHAVFTQNGFLVRPMGASVPVIYEARDPAGTARAHTFACMWWGVFWMLPLASVTLFGAFAGVKGLVERG